MKELFDTKYQIPIFRQLFKFFVVIARKIKRYLLLDVTNTTLVLRYYATFKVRKFESFYKINTCLQKTTTCFGLRAEQIFSVNV